MRKLEKEIQESVKLLNLQFYTSQLNSLAYLIKTLYPYTFGVTFVTIIFTT